MATVATIKDEMHIASCAELSTLKGEADLMVVAYPEMTSWFTHHVYREYNRRKFFYCSGANMISPYDGGFAPIGYTPTGGSISITVTNGIAQTDIGGTNYEWPVEVGGTGAAANQFAVTDGVIMFTVSSVNYQFAASVGGAGSATIDISNGMATTTISSVNYEWAVSPV